ncbi:hypothetical protein S83_022036, partial [Arachis hypogaea]
VVPIGRRLPPTTLQRKEVKGEREKDKTKQRERKHDGKERKHDGRRRRGWRQTGIHLHYDVIVHWGLELEVDERYLHNLFNQIQQVISVQLGM